jgi:Holliday junction resolvase RusA-like endonuclease
LPPHHEPWEGPVSVTIRWFGRGGPIPDADNIIARCTSYTDSAQHAGLYANDSQISGFTVERGYDRERPRVEIAFSHAAIEP